MTDILHCRGCGRAFGVAPHLVGSVYCSEICMLDGALTENEERDDLIRLVRWTTDKSLLQIGIMFDIARQRVAQIVSADPLRS